MGYAIDQHTGLEVSSSYIQAVVTQWDSDERAFSVNNVRPSRLDVARDHGPEYRNPYVDSRIELDLFARNQPGNTGYDMTNSRYVYADARPPHVGGRPAVEGSLLLKMSGAEARLEDDLVHPCVSNMSKIGAIWNPHR